MSCWAPSSGKAVPLGAWLCGVARFKAYQVLANASTAPVATDPDEQLDAEDPEVGFLRQEYGGVLSRVLDALPHAERTAISLLLQGSSYQEIATATGDPESTIRTRVARACQRLKTRIAALELSLS